MAERLDQVKRMSVKEFRDLGYLQELNRQFLHPLGLALEYIVDVDKDGNETGTPSFGEIWDCREGGIEFSDDIVKDPKFGQKAVSVMVEQIKRSVNGRLTIIPVEITTMRAT